jgi:iron complex outermembrane recepter protein
MRFRNLALNLDYDLGFAKLTVIPAYAWSGRVAISSLVTGEIQGVATSSLTGGAATVVVPYYPYLQNPAGSQEFIERQKTLELRLTSSSASKLKWVVGGLYLDATNQPSATSLAALYPAAATGYITTPGGDRPTKSKSVFGQITYSLTDAFRVTAGLRYNKDERSFPYGIKTVRLPIVSATGAITSNTPFVTCTVGTNVNTGGLATCTPTAVPIVDTGISYKNTSYSATTWKAGIEYDLAPQSMLYADISTGYKAGGFSINGAQNPYKPEYLTSYDLGIKNRFRDNTLQVNASAYYYVFKDYQISSANFALTNLVCDSAFTNGVSYTALGLCQVAAATTTATVIPGLVNGQVTINGGTGKTYGFELENQWLFTPTNKLDVNLSYLHARYGLINTGANYFLDSDSYQVVSDSPEWSGNIGLEHYFNFKNGGSLTLRGESKLSSFYYNSVNRLDGNSLTQIVYNGVRYPLLNNGNSASAAYQPSYTRSNAYLTYHTADQHWTVVAWVKNLENKAQKVNTFPRNRTWLSDPQTYGLNISTKF